jgi:hypothetical protein
MEELVVLINGSIQNKLIRCFFAILTVRLSLAPNIIFGLVRLIERQDAIESGDRAKGGLHFCFD